MNVMVGISGGVDSAVAALLLRDQGHAVSGLFMRNWEDDAPESPCPAEADRNDAVAVCAALGIRFHARNFAAQYRDRVFAHFLAQYRAGRTPNPDVLCNREIKFRTFLDEAREIGADKIATGHYARIEQRDGRWRLLRGRDADKDQSYFLHALDQQQLAAALFPLGEMEKPQVRQLARAAGLRVHAKKDSTGICFIGERRFHEFLSRYLPAKVGPILDTTGKPLGQHDGSMYYTLGQRQGLGLGGRAEGSGAAWYVVGKNTAANALFVAQGNANHWLASRRLRATELSWIDGTPPASAFNASAKVRYRQPDQAVRVRIDGDTASVDFEQPQRAVAAGQSVVFYAGEVCLGGGVIEATDAPFGGLA